MDVLKMVSSSPDDKLDDITIDTTAVNSNIVHHNNISPQVSPSRKKLVRKSPLQKFIQQFTYGSITSDSPKPNKQQINGQSSHTTQDSRTITFNLPEQKNNLTDDDGKLNGHRGSNHINDTNYKVSSNTYDWSRLTSTFGTAIKKKKKNSIRISMSQKVALTKNNRSSKSIKHHNTNSHSRKTSSDKSLTTQRKDITFITKWMKLPYSNTTSQNSHLLKNISIDDDDNDKSSHDNDADIYDEEEDEYIENTADTSSYNGSPKVDSNEVSNEYISDMSIHRGSSNEYEKLHESNNNTYDITDNINATKDNDINKDTCIHTDDLKNSYPEYERNNENQKKKKKKKSYDVHDEKEKKEDNNEDNNDYNNDNDDDDGYSYSDTSDCSSIDHIYNTTPSDNIAMYSDPQLTHTHTHPLHIHYTNDTKKLQLLSSSVRQSTLTLYHSRNTTCMRSSSKSLHTQTSLSNKQNDKRISHLLMNHRTSSSSNSHKSSHRLSTSQSNINNRPYLTFSHPLLNLRPRGRKQVRVVSHKSTPAPIVHTNSNDDHIIQAQEDKLSHHTPTATTTTTAATTTATATATATTVSKKSTRSISNSHKKVKSSKYQHLFNTLLGRKQHHHHHNTYTTNNATTTATASQYSPTTRQSRQSRISSSYSHMKSSSSSSHHMMKLNHRVSMRKSHSNMSTHNTTTTTTTTTSSRKVNGTKVISKKSRIKIFDITSSYDSIEKEKEEYSYHPNDSIVPLSPYPSSRISDTLSPAASSSGSGEMKLVNEKEKCIDDDDVTDFSTKLQVKPVMTSTTNIMNNSTDAYITPDIYKKFRSSMYTMFD